LSLSLASGASAAIGGPAADVLTPKMSIGIGTGPLIGIQKGPP
jgi:hypothetical protein